MCRQSGATSESWDGHESPLAGLAAPASPAPAPSAMRRDGEHADGPGVVRQGPHALGRLELGRIRRSVGQRHPLGHVALRAHRPPCAIADEAPLLALPCSPGLGTFAQGHRASRRGARGPPPPTRAAGGRRPAGVEGAPLIARRDHRGGALASAIPAPSQERREPQAVLLGGPPRPRVGGGACGPAWTTDLLNGDHFTGGSSTPAAVAGYPNVQVPAGYVYGLPVGISFYGRAFTEPKLIRLAYAYEQATKHRRPPRLLPGADLSGRG